MTVILKCAMQIACAKTVTHIGDIGFVYCAEHALARRSDGYERTRVLREWELEHLRNRRPLQSYTPITKAEDQKRRAQVDQE